MKIHCEAIAEDSRLQDNLCECIGILGGSPNKNGSTVSVEYEGEESKVLQFISLFEQFSQHEIHTELQKIAT